MSTTHARRCFPLDKPRKPKGGFIQRTPTEHCSSTPYVFVFLAYADWRDDEDDVDSIDSVWDDDSTWDDHDHGTDWGTTAESPHGLPLLLVLSYLSFVGSSLVLLLLLCVLSSKLCQYNMSITVS